MTTPNKWSNVAVAMQSALATALAVTGITKASPGVVSYTGTDPANGDYVYLEIQGMYQLDKRVVRVANVNGAGNTFELEGVDTTLFDTFTSGTAQVITFGTTISSFASLSASGGDFAFLDTTTIHDNIKKQIPGLPNPITYNFENIWDVSDAGQVALKNASDNQLLRAFKFTFATSQKMVFTGYVGHSGTPTGQAQDIVKTPSVITLFGTPTFYSS